MTRSRRTISLLPAACAMLFAGCATTQMDAQWSNPEYSGRSLRGESVLVACEAAELTLQRICEDQVAAQVSARGAKPTKNSTLTAAGAPPAGATDPYSTAAKRIGASVIVRTTLAAGPPIVSDSGPVIGFGLGGGSYGGGGSYRSGGAGITLPIGGTKTTQALSAETVLINPANGVTMWSGRASSATNLDAGGQVTELAKVIVEAVQKSGML